MFWRDGYMKSICISICMACNYVDMFIHGRTASSLSLFRRFTIETKCDKTWEYDSWKILMEILDEFLPSMILWKLNLCHSADEEKLHFIIKGLKMKQFFFVLSSLSWIRIRAMYLNVKASREVSLSYVSCLCYRSAAPLQIEL